MVRASLAIATLIAAAPAPVTRAGGAPPLGVAAWTPVILLERSGPSSDTSDAHFAGTTSAAAWEWGPPPRPPPSPSPPSTRRPARLALRPTPDPHRHCHHYRRRARRRSRPAAP